MKSSLIFIIALNIITSAPVFGQVNPKEVNGARNSAEQGTELDTNVSFTLRMSLADDITPLDTVSIGEDVSIVATIRPESADIGSSADIIVVDFAPPNLRMRNIDGNFDKWNGSLRTLVPALEGVTLEAEQDVEVFSGQLGTTGNHRIFVGFVTNEILYFTPNALRFDIEAAPEPEKTAAQLSIELFDSAISPDIVHTSCITCHVSGGSAFGLATHTFVRTSDPEHLNKNYIQFKNLHTLRGTDFILDKVSGNTSHVGGALVQSGSNNFANLQAFLELLDQASE